MASQQLKPLMRACKAGDSTEVRTLLADKNVLQLIIIIIIIIDIYHWFFLQITKFRTTQTDINERDALERTAIFYCVDNVDTQCLSLLLDAHADIDFQDKAHYTCLHLAVIAGNKTIVEYLISQGADINLKDCDAHSVLHWAVVCGQEHLISYLLKNEANPDTADIHGAYPIHYAAQMCGEVEIWDDTISRDPVKSKNKTNS